MRLYPPAKINWTLEVLGRRSDGYHEVWTLLQTVDVRDTLEVEPARTVELAVEGVGAASEDDLVLRAANLLEDGGRGARIRLEKHIPVAAGLGGGSSDAAATLRGLNEHWRLGLDDEALEEKASRLGSDVPFFLHGGTALAEGRGERVTPLPDATPVWLVLLVPSRRRPEEKTKRMYQALEPADFGDGSRTKVLARRIEAGHAVNDDGLYNAFERVAFEVFEGLVAYRDELLAAGARRVHLVGSGPSLFALCPGEGAARELRTRLRPAGAKVMVARTIGRLEALRREA